MLRKYNEDTWKTEGAGGEIKKDYLFLRLCHGHDSEYPLLCLVESKVSLRSAGSAVNSAHKPGRCAQ